MTPSGDPRPDDRRGWLVVAAGTLGMVFTFGNPYSYGVILGPLADLTGLSRVTLSGVFSVELFLFYAGAGVLGVYATRLSARLVLVACGVLAAAVAPALYLTASLAGLVLVFGLLGVATGTAFVVLASVVPRWFEARRGTAAGVLFAGAGLSLQVVPPAWQVAIDRLGVRGGFLAVALASGAAFLVAGAVVRRPPWVDRGADASSDALAWLAGLVGNRRFQLLFVGVGLAFAWYYVLAAFAIDLFEARGVSRTAASVAFGLVGGVSAVSRLGSGAIADRVGHVRTLLVSLGFAALGSALLFVPGIHALGLAVLSYGIGLGGIATLYIPVLLSIYGPEMDTAIVGTFNVAFGVFALLAPPVATVVVAETGAFRPGIALAGATTLVSMGAIWLATR